MIPWTGRGRDRSGAGPERRRLSIRARAMLAFGLVSFVLSGTLALVAYSLVRNALVADRQTAAMRQAYTNARAVRTRISADDRAVTSLLAGLQLASTGDVLLQRDGRWYTSSVEADRSVVPVSLRQGVDQGHAGSQVASTSGAPALVVGVPISALNASYYEVNSLEDLNRTLRVLGSSLLVAAVVAAGCGALTGAVVSRSVVRPLRLISAVATDIAAGESDARLRAGGDPDLEPLAVSFNGMVDELEERIERESRFASDVSHDLRGPLTALSAAVSVVNRRRDQLPPEASRAIHLLDEQVVAFNKLVVDLLEISRFEAGTAVLQSREVALADFVQAVVEERGETTPIHVATDLDLRVSIDPRRMHQVLANLLDNAENYGGGATRIEIGPGTSPNRVQVRVDDQGPGVGPQERQMIFDRFHRGRSGTMPGAPRGTGLGLALAFDHVVLHDGGLWVEDAPAGGARFVIDLPAVSSTPEEVVG